MIRDIPLASIVIPPEIVRESSSKVDDDILAKSIRESGIQQPLIALSVGGEIRLVNGARRLSIARALGLPKAPVIVGEVPAGEDADAFARRLRFILHEHQQDLLPSQRAELIGKLKAMMSLNNKDVARWLGVDQDTITNWLSLRRYAPQIVAALDAGEITSKAARVFDGMTEAGQTALWKRHREEITTAGGAESHKSLREKYPPSHYPAFYRDPSAMERRLAAKASGRAGKKRPDYSSAEKRRMLASVDFERAELEELQREQTELKADIAAAVPLVAAVLRENALRRLVPAETLPELQRFAEVYC